MVEASMVLPLLILSVLTCLLISMFFYETSLRQCQMHVAMRCSADDLTGCTVNLASDSQGLEESYKKYTITQKKQVVFDTISGKEHIDMIHRGILHHRVSADLESLWHASDGVTYVRYCTLLPKQSEKR